MAICEKCHREHEECCPNACVCAAMAASPTLTIILPNDKGGFQKFLNAQAAIWEPIQKHKKLGGLIDVRSVDLVSLNAREIICELTEQAGISISEMLVMPVYKLPMYGATVMEQEVALGKVH